MVWIIRAMNSLYKLPMLITMSCHKNGSRKKKQLHCCNSVFSILTVDFFDFKTKKDYCVEGRFALRSPWWEVNCHVRWSRGKRVMKGYPSYKLRSDLDRKGWISILSLFLNACEVEPDFIRNFFDWLPPNRNVTFSNLDEVVEEFSEGNEAVAQHITCRLSSSGL